MYNTVIPMPKRFRTSNSIDTQRGSGSGSSVPISSVVKDRANDQVGFTKADKSSEATIQSSGARRLPGNSEGTRKFPAAVRSPAISKQSQVLSNQASISKERQAQRWNPMLRLQEPQMQSMQRSAMALLFPAEGSGVRGSAQGPFGAQRSANSFATAQG
jgi:hypothetical protein